MLTGAIVGAELVLQANATAALALATALLAVLTVAAARTTLRPGSWRATNQPAPAPQRPGDVDNGPKG